MAIFEKMTSAKRIIWFQKQQRTRRWMIMFILVVMTIYFVVNSCSEKTAEQDDEKNNNAIHGSDNSRIVKEEQHKIILSSIKVSTHQIKSLRTTSALSLNRSKKKETLSSNIGPRFETSSGSIDTKSSTTSSSPSDDHYRLESPSLSSTEDTPAVASNGFIVPIRYPTTRASNNNRGRKGAKGKHNIRITSLSIHTASSINDENLKIRLSTLHSHTSTSLTAVSTNINKYTLFWEGLAEPLHFANDGGDDGFKKVKRRISLTSNEQWKTGSGILLSPGDIVILYVHCKEPVLLHSNISYSSSNNTDDVAFETDGYGIVMMQNDNLVVYNRLFCKDEGGLNMAPALHTSPLNDNATSKKKDNNNGHQQQQQLWKGAIHHRFVVSEKPSHIIVMTSLSPLPLKNKPNDENMSGDDRSSTRRNMMSQQLTTLHGGNGSYGTIFTLETHNPSKQHHTTSLTSTSMTNDSSSNISFPTIEIASLSVVLETELDPITKVYPPAQITVLARLGAFENVEHKANDWMTIHEASVEPIISDNGHFQLTEIGPFLKPIVILGGAAVTERQQLSLYVTSDTKSVVYTNVNQEVGDVFVTNKYFDTLVGVGVGALAFTGGGASDDSGNEEGSGNGNAGSKTKEEMLLSSVIFPERMANVEIPYIIRPSPKLFSQPSAHAASLPSKLHQYNHPSSVETTLEGGNGSYGTMFTIKALQDVVITSLDIHTDKYVGVHVTVYTKLGKFDDAANIKQAMDWDVVSGNVTIMGQGFGSYTPIISPREYNNQDTDNADDEKSNSIGFIPIFAQKDEIRSFYVSLSTPDLRYTDSKPTHNDEGNSASGDEHHQPKVGDIYTVTPNEMEVHIGVGIGEKFFSYQEKPYQNRIFNGRIHYQTLGPSYSPTIHPSDPPSEQPSDVIMIHEDGSITVRTQQMITLEGIDPNTLLGEDQADLFETVAKRFLADLTKEKGVAITNVEISFQGTHKIFYQNKDNHYITDNKNIISRDEQHRGRDHNGRQLQVDTAGSQGGLEVFATVTGEYSPPPHINFEHLVSDSFNDKGNAFLQDLKEEERDRDDGDDLFKSVRSMKAEPTEFLIDTTPSPTSSPSNSTVISPSKGEELELSSRSSGIGNNSSTNIILFSTICVLVTLILVISFLYYILILHPNLRSRRKLGHGSLNHVTPGEHYLY